MLPYFFIKEAVSIFTPFVLDKARNLRFGMKALSLVEKKLGVNIAKIDFENLTMEQLATFIWAGLTHEDNDLTPDKVMDLIDEYSNIQDAVDVVSKAIAESFGTGTEKN